MLAVLALLLVPASATAERVEERASLGDVQATLSYEVAEHDGFEHYRDLRLVVRRAGAVVHDAPVEIARGVVCEGFCRPADVVAGRRSVLVRDLDADGVPDAVVRLFTGGAYCCVVGVVVRPGAGVLRRDFGSAGFRLGTDGLFVTADRRFDFAFGPHAASAMPVQLLRVRGGRFVDVTRAEGRVRVRRDAAALWRSWRSVVRRGQARHAAGILAAWAADRYRLGARRSALRTVRAQARRGRVARSFPRTLDRRLRAWGYAR